MAYRTIILAIVSWIAYDIALSQSNIASILKERMQQKDIPGAAFIIAKNGKILEQGYFGKANIELRVPVSEESVFAIASMSKTYTATAILMLQEEGKLMLSDPVKKYIPEAPDTWNGITLKHLLTHSSGIVDDWDLFTWQKSNEYFIQSQNDSAFLEVLFRQDLLFEPGTNTHYSCGPFVLGVVIERITSEYYGAYLKRKIFEPIGLKNTFVDDPYQIIPNRVSGYFPYDKFKLGTKIVELGNGLLISPLAYGRADVGIRTTAIDVMTFYDALVSGKLLSNDSQELMFGPSSLDNGELNSYGAGWMNWPLGGRFISEHGGYFRTGFSSRGFVIPDERFIIVILSNMFDALNFPFVQKIAAMYYPEFKQLSLRDIEIDRKPQLTQTHLEFFQGIEKNPKDPDICNQSYPQSYLPDNAKKVISKIESVEYIGEDDVLEKQIEHFETSIHRLRYYKLIGENPLYTTVYLDEEDKIIFIDYPESE